MTLLLLSETDIKIIRFVHKWFFGIVGAAITTYYVFFANETHYNWLFVKSLGVMFLCAFMAAITRIMLDYELAQFQEKQMTKVIYYQMLKDDRFKVSK